MLYLSGAIGLDPKTGQFVGEGVEEQARQVDYILMYVWFFDFILGIKKSW